jgi:preprotein translocase SecF subunit
LSEIAAASALAPFRVRSFRYQWPADLATSWAFEMETLILGWYILVETGSVLLLAVFASLQYLGTLIAPFVGVMADRLGHGNVLSGMRAIYATLASILGITIYIAIRFRFSFAVGAMAATLHDILVTVAFLVFFGYDLSLNVIAALLAITGYSVNDTIVIFDRVRENQHLLRRESLVKIVNESVNQTLSRTVITAGTTFLAVLSLFLFGGEVLNGFAFTMLVGIVSGTYSTIFIAAAVAIILSKAAPVRTAPAAAPTPGTGKAGRKAKAS